jgi:hypothetical protein
MMNRYAVRLLHMYSMHTNINPQSTVSSIVEDCLANLARKHEFTHFVKLSYLEAEMDPVSIPAILAYKGGELIANLVNVVDEIPAGRDMSASSLESILRTHKVL